MSTASNQVQVPATGDLNAAIERLEAATAASVAERALLAAERTTFAGERAAMVTDLTTMREQTTRLDAVTHELEALKAQRAAVAIMEQQQAGQGHREYTGMAQLAGYREAKIERAYDTFAAVVHDIACLKWGRKLQFGRLAEYVRDGQTLGTGTDGGSVVPYPILEEISVLQEKFGLARRLCSFVKMTAHKMGKNAFGSDATFTYPNESSAPAISQVLLRTPRGELEAKLGVVNMKMSQQLQLDAPLSLQKFYMDRLFTLAGMEEDRVFIAANNSPSPWYGVLYHPDVPVMPCATQSYGGIIAEEIVGTLHKVSKHVRGKATWIVSQDMIGVMQGMKDGEGRPLWSPMGAMQAPVIYGRPYEDTPAMPDREAVVGDEAGKPFLACGSWKDAAIFGDRMTTAIDFDGSVYFESGALAIRLMVDFGIYFVQPTACARAETSA